MAKHQRGRGREGVWRRVLAKHAASGLSVRAFCRREKLSEASFYSWRRTIGQRDAESSLGTAGDRPRRGRRGRQPQRPAFLPVVVDGEQDRGGAIMIQLASGLAVRLPEGVSARRLAELVEVLEARGSTG